MENPYAVSWQNMEPASIREVANPLIQNTRWTRILGIMCIVIGALLCLGIWPVLVAWLPIWAGVVLIQAAGCLNAKDNPAVLQQGFEKLALGVKLLAIAGIVFTTLMVLLIAAYAVLIAVVIGMSGNNMP